MNIDTIKSEIREKLKTAHNHISIHNVNEPYKNILEGEINLKSENVEAYCLLGIVFLKSPYKMFYLPKKILSVFKVYIHNPTF